MQLMLLQGFLTLSIFFWSSIGYAVDKAIEYKFMNNHESLGKVDLALDTFLVLMLLLLVSYLIDVIKLRKL